MVVAVWASGWAPTRGQEPRRGDAAPTWADAEARVLLVGNSFTSFNRLDRLVAALAQAGGRTVYAAAIAPGGYRFDQHAEQAAAPRSPLAQALGRGAPGWDVVVLQNQSQIPAFEPREGIAARNLDAVVELGQRVRDAGAETVLFQTWGYLRGDPRNATLADFGVMQDALTAGYARYRERLKRARITARIAPVGEAFRAVHAAERKAKRDPLQPGSRFHALYTQDTRHPALPGSYLAAAVILGTVLDAPVADFDWAPPPLDAETARALREIADASRHTR